MWLVFCCVLNVYRWHHARRVYSPKRDFSGKQFKVFWMSCSVLCLVYILIETARDKTRTRVWRIHSSRLPHSRPVLISSRSSQRHVCKSVSIQRKWECLECFASLSMILARECECLHSSRLHLAKSLYEYSRRECKPGIIITSPWSDDGMIQR